MKRDVRAASHWGQDAAAQPATVRLCEFAVWRKRRNAFLLGGSLSPLSKCLRWNKGDADVALCLFEVTERLYSHEPAPLHRCSTRRLPEWAWKAIIVSAVVVSLWDRSPKLCSSHYQRLSTSIHFFPASRWIQGEQWHAGLGVCNCAFLCMFTGTTSYRCAAHLTRHSCVDFSSCHMVWDLKLIYIPLQGGLCSLIYEIELASSFCSCSVITCTAAGEKLYATWLFDNELSIATHSKKNKKIKNPLQCLF